MSIVLKNTQGAAANGIKLLVYGDSGIGKTSLIGTAPSPVVFSAEAGLLSLASIQIPYVSITNLNELNDAYQWALSSHEARQFQTVCLDSITEVGGLVLAHALSQVKDPRQAYGELMEKMSSTIRLFRDLPGKNVYLSAQEVMQKDDDSGITKYTPSMPGKKLGPQMPYFFDEVFRMRIGRTAEGSEYRYLQTQPDFNSVAKDRSGKLSPMEEPHLGKIFAKITN